MTEVECNSASPEPEWKLAPLAQHLISRSPPLWETHDRIKAIGRYIVLYQYHIEVASASLDEIDLQYGHIRQAFRTGPEFDEYHWLHVAIEANILAGAHCVRSIVDILAVVINESVLQGAIRVDRCSLWTATQALPDSTLKRNLDALSNSESFAYLSAFINMSKHRALVRHQVRIPLDDQPGGSWFKRFDFNDVTYEEKTTADVLGCLREVGCRITDCGVALNHNVLGDP